MTKPTKKPTVESDLAIPVKINKPSILNQMEFHLVQNLKEIIHHDNIPLNLKENENPFLPIGFEETKNMETNESGGKIHVGKRGNK